MWNSRLPSLRIWSKKENFITVSWFISLNPTLDLLATRLYCFDVLHVVKLITFPCVTNSSHSIFQLLVIHFFQIILINTENELQRPSNSCSPCGASVNLTHNCWISMTKNKELPQQLRNLVKPQVHSSLASYLSYDLVQIESPEKSKLNCSCFTTV